MLLHGLPVLVKFVTSAQIGRVLNSFCTLSDLAIFLYLSKSIGLQSLHVGAAVTEAIRKAPRGIHLAANLRSRRFIIQAGQKLRSQVIETAVGCIFVEGSFLSRQIISDTRITDVWEPFRTVSKEA